MGDVFFYIIVVSYNAGGKLTDTLTSIRRQTYDGIRVLIKDGMSDDGSVERACKEFCIGADGESDDGKIRLLQSRDHGIYDAMNEAIGIVIAEEDARPHKKPIVYFLNCGDTLYAGHVLKDVAKAVSAYAEDHDADDSVYYGDVMDFATGEEIPSNPKITDFACYRNVPCHQACFYDLSLMRDARFNRKFAVRADYEHFLRLKYRKGASFYYLSQTICCYEGGGYSESAENKVRSEQERERIIKHYLPAWKVRLFDLYRVMSLQKVREKIARSPVSAAAYNRVKKLLYRRK